MKFNSDSETYESWMLILRNLTPHSSAHNELILHDMGTFWIGISWEDYILFKHKPNPESSFELSIKHRLDGPCRIWRDPEDKDYFINDSSLSKDKWLIHPEVVEYMNKRSLKKKLENL